jgi:hypothetical protein
MHRPSPRLEMLSNAALVLAAVVLSAGIARQLLRPPRATPRPTSLPAGSRLRLPVPDAAQAQHALVLVLSAGCRFCSESAPFYRRLLAEAALYDRLRVIAVLPQDKVEGEAYLETLQLRIPTVVSAPLQSLPVFGTPVVALLDPAGSVTDSWSGKLSTDQEEKVLATLARRARPALSSTTSSPSMTASGWGRALNRRNSVPMCAIHGRVLLPDIPAGPDANGVYSWVGVFEGWSPLHGLVRRPGASGVGSAPIC